MYVHVYTCTTVPVSECSDMMSEIYSVIDYPRPRAARVTKKTQERITTPQSLPNHFPRQLQLDVRLLDDTLYI